MKADSDNPDFLIVDDDGPVRTSLVRFLEDCCYEVKAFSSGEDMLNFLKTGGRSKAAVIDVRLGGIQGDELLEKSLAIAPEINYAIFTGSVDFTLSEALIKAGVSRDQVLLKPLQDLEVLKKLVE